MPHDSGKRSADASDDETVARSRARGAKVVISSAQVLAACARVEARLNLRPLSADGDRVCLPRSRTSSGQGLRLPWAWTSATQMAASTSRRCIAPHAPLSFEPTRSSNRPRSTWPGRLGAAACGARRWSADAVRRRVSFSAAPGTAPSLRTSCHARASA